MTTELYNSKIDLAITKILNTGHVTIFDLKQRLDISFSQINQSINRIKKSKELSISQVAGMAYFSIKG